MKTRFFVVLLLFSILGLYACGSAATPAPYYDTVPQEAPAAPQSEAVQP